MSDIVTITNDGRNLTLNAPHDPALLLKARALGGWWSRTAKKWVFDARDEARVRALSIELFGSDGSDADEPTVTVRVPVHDTASRDQEIRLAGRRLAWRSGRDGSVRLTAGVVIIEGEFTSSGGLAEGVVLEVRDVPHSVAERMRSEQPDVSVLDDGTLVREALLTERARLLARLAEIDSALGEET